VDLETLENESVTRLMKMRDALQIVNDLVGRYYTTELTIAELTQEVDEKLEEKRHV